MSLKQYDWDFSRLEELIEARGDDVIVETAVACTCRNDDLYGSTIEVEGRSASRRKVTCPSCYGDGYIYRNPRKVKGLLTSVTAQKTRNMTEMGYLLPGDMVFSPSLSAGIISDFDKITFLYPTDVNEGQVILRGAAHMEENQLIDPGLEPHEDRIWYEAVCASWCEDENKVQYKQGTDFVFSKRKVQWIGSAPAKGVLYTIKYSAYTEWVAFENTMTRVDRGRTLGGRVALRRRHIVFSKKDPNQSSADCSVEFSTKTTI